MKEFNINGHRISYRECIKSDKNFILKTVKDLLFPYIQKYCEPRIDLLEKRFDKDYKERFVLMKDDINIGFFQYIIEDKVFWIKGMFLLEKYQNKGIGTFIMHHLERLAKENNCEILELKVWENNPAVDFYKKLGYRIVKTRNHKHVMKKEIA